MNTAYGKASLFVFTLALVLSCQGCVGSLFYQPDRTVYDTPDRHGLAYEQVTFQSRDGTRLSGWFIPAMGTPRGTVIHFHGNAQNMTAHFGFVSWLPARGFNLFIFDYRGYGASDGTPDRRGVYEDSLVALDYLATRPGLDHNRILVLGQSLGGANAIAAVASRPHGNIRAVAVDSAFASYRGIVRDKIAAIPLLSLVRTPLARLLIGDDASPDGAVANIAPTPLLIIHGTGDRVVPYSHGQRLFAVAREPKQFWSVEGGEHTDAFADPGSPYRQRLVAFFNETLDGRIVAGKANGREAQRVQ
ncbi:alpha/beta hydrolase [Geobacter sp. FeAm09]|uniref:alpha/beta hydrolase n=1 Tax=Geobacter sp. FeAm09 TaxID=2597769 RepID=UPI0011EE3359|nr:alpha/beta hydrolase [Geobacter sp. FeAm09]QEM68830.1 alpha/beta hydrolase [Geobacter sp. FeAm09]